MKSLDELLSEHPRAKRIISVDDLIKITRKKTCPKCHGLGVIPEYLNVKAGKCFECNGSGTI